MDNQIYNLFRKTRPFLLHGFIFVLAITMIQACGDDDDDGPTGPNGSEQNIVEVAQSDDQFSTLVSSLEDAGLTSTLEGEGPYTVFAPTDSAFENLPDGLLDTLSTDQLSELLSYHVVSSNILSTDLEAEQTVDALAGGQLFVTSNGEVTVNDTATVISADIEASNGTIHAVDAVLLPDAYQTVTGVVIKRYELQSLEDAVVNAGLSETLDGEGPYTVFAPSNDAFEGVDLSGLSEEEVQDILTYHVLPEQVLSSDIESGSYTTVNGATIDINADAEGSVSLTDQAGNTYTVTTADLQGTNGVVHIIDGVLMPSSE